MNHSPCRWRRTAEKYVAFFSQVILATQFMVSNQLDFDVELQMFTEPDYVSNPLVEVTYESIVFSSGTTSSTRCVPVEKIRRFRVRRTGSPWSESVVISAKSEHILIQVGFFLLLRYYVFLTSRKNARNFHCRCAADSGVVGFYDGGTLQPALPSRSSR